MNDSNAIKVKSVSKTFKLPHERQTSLKNMLIHFRRGLGYEKQQVLDDVSFEINKGDFFGIVGRNGSGKSTLLKLLAGIYTPDSGQITINGKLTPFIELGVGFNPELSGRENVFLNGALLGFSRPEMEAMYDDIVAFAELERFMDQKLKNYSSGMQVRLAFSIAIRANTDILVLDEVLAVGDAAFQSKCQEYFYEVKNQKKTVVLVTHDMAAVERYCNRALLIDNGKVVEMGYPKTVADKYLDMNRVAQAKSMQREESKAAERADDFVDEDAEITEFKALNDKGEKTKTFRHLEKICLNIEYTLKNDLKDAVLDMGLMLGKHGQTYFYTNTQQHEQVITASKGSRVRACVELPNVFMSGMYYVYSSIYNPRTLKVYARNRSLTKIYIEEPPFIGVVAPEHKLDVKIESKK